MLPWAFTQCLPEIPSTVNRLNMFLFRKRTKLFLPSGEMRELKSWQNFFSNQHLYFLVMWNCHCNVRQKVDRKYSSSSVMTIDYKGYFWHKICSHITKVYKVIFHCTSLALYLFVHIFKRYSLDRPYYPKQPANEVEFKFILLYSQILF